MAMSYLDNCRKEIDEVDKQLTELFEKRMVIKYKIKNKIPVLNSSREEEVIKKNSERLRNKELEPYLKDFFIRLMDLSKDYQSHKINNVKSRY